MIQSQVSHYPSFDLYFFSVHFPFYFIASSQLYGIHHPYCRKHLDRSRFYISIKNNRSTGLTIQSTSSSFRLPFIAISVTVKTNRLTFLYIFFQYSNNRLLFTFPCLNFLINLFFKETKLMGNCRIKNDHSRRTIGRRTDCSEFKTISGKSKWGCSVSIRIIHKQFGNLRYIEFHPCFITQLYYRIIRTVF